MELSAIESRILATCLELRPQHPEAFEGYYDRLLSAGRILTDADRAIVEYVVKNFDRYGAVLEICAGLAQLSHAIWLSDFTNVTAIEKGRYAPAMILGKWLASGVMVVPGKWPDVRISADLIICTNAVSQAIMPENAALLDEALDECCELIWQPAMFGVMGVELLEAEADEIAPGVWHQWK